MLGSVSITRSFRLYSGRSVPVPDAQLIHPAVIVRRTVTRVMSKCQVDRDRTRFIAARPPPTLSVGKHVATLGPARPGPARESYDQGQALVGGQVFAEDRLKWFIEVSHARARK